VAGEVDASAHHHLQLIAEVLACREGAVDFDLGNVTFMDSSGWAAVQAAAYRAQARIVNPSAEVRHVTDLISRTRTAARRLTKAA
jgi:anti-anti-sigma regulatory factor